MNRFNFEPKAAGQPTSVSVGIRPASGNGASPPGSTETLPKDPTPEVGKTEQDKKDDVQAIRNQENEGGRFVGVPAVEAPDAGTESGR